MIKSILLHLANDPGHAGRLGVALDLAARHGASLRAIFAEPTGGMPAAVAGRGASYAYVSESREAARETAARLSRELGDICAREGIACEWIDEPGEPARLIADAASLADLVIVGRGSSDLGLEPETCEELPADLPCPLLTIPERWTQTPVGRRVVIAWRRDLAASRALRGAVPLLRDAESVVVLTVGEKESVAADAVRYLAAHGVEATPRRDYGDGDDAGEVILGVADEIGADLIVMGSYSRSRIREMMLGGATRHVVTHMRRPVLFSH